METADQLRRRRSTLTDLHSITSTMRTLSAINIRHYENAVLALAKHDHIIDLGFTALVHARNSQTTTAAMTASTHTKIPPVCAIVFGTDHGLCGRFNEEIADHAYQRLAVVPMKKPSAAGSSISRAGNISVPAQVLVAGFRMAPIVEQLGLPVEKTVPLPGSVEGITSLVQQLLLHIDHWQNEHNNALIILFHNRMESGPGYQPVTTTLLPMQYPDRSQIIDWPSRKLPVVRLATSILLKALVRQRLFITLYRACAESQASEHASRLATMQVACRNIEEKLQEVTSIAHRQRQSAITTELLDTVAGFDAVTRN